MVVDGNGQGYRDLGVNGGACGDFVQKAVVINVGVEGDSVGGG